MDQSEVQSFLIIFSVVAFLLVLTVVFLFIFFQNRKNKLLREKEKEKHRFRQELIESQVEIREETLRNISWELHDNIGQLLTLAKIQLQNAGDNQEQIEMASETIGNSLNELRSLSKLINPDTLTNLSLVEALKLEIERFNRMKYLDATLMCSNCDFEMDNKVEIIIFRILQEFFTNTAKHSKASKLSVELHNDGERLHIEARDNGIGFDTNEIDPGKGIGLSNILNRAELIGADVEINSKEGKGTHLRLSYKLTPS